MKTPRGTKLRRLLPYQEPVPEATRVISLPSVTGDATNNIILSFPSNDVHPMFASAVPSFTNYFEPRINNVIYERAQFNTRVQLDGEPAAVYIQALFHLAKTCEFNKFPGHQEEMVRDRLVVGLQDERLKVLLQQEDKLDLQRAWAIIRNSERFRQPLVQPVISSGPQVAPWTPVGPFAAGPGLPKGCGLCGVGEWHSEMQCPVNNSIRYHPGEVGDFARAGPNRPLADQRQMQQKMPSVTISDHNTPDRLEVATSSDAHFSSDGGASCSTDVFIKAEPADLPHLAVKPEPGEVFDVVVKVEPVDHYEAADCKNQPNPLNVQPVGTAPPPQPEQFICPTCNKSFTLKRYLVAHELRHAEVKRFPCPDCDKSFTTRCVLLTHQAVRHIPKQPSLNPEPGTYKYVCSTCNKEFAKRKQLVAHELGHANRKRYPCRFCEKSFPARYQIMRHESLHSPELSMQKPFPCTLCDKKFADKNILAEHVLRHSDVRPFPCTICSKSFVNRAEFKRHQLHHAGVKPHSCSVCGRKFSNKTHCTNHERLHTKFKPFLCGSCPRAFYQKSALKSHELCVHAPDKPSQFVCPTCGKAFRLKTNLVVHERSHSGLRPFTCEFCDRSFSQQGSLLKHKNTHLPADERRNNFCEICGKAFMCLRNLKKHIKLHSQESPPERQTFECETCGKIFSSKRNVGRHAQIHMQQVEDAA